MKFGSFPSSKSQMQEWVVQGKFGPPEASHHGGIYERKIGTIKASNGFPNVLTKSPTDDKFLTAIKMAKCIMNCRPLSKCQCEKGLPLLRPIDLMMGACDPDFILYIHTALLHTICC